MVQRSPSWTRTVTLFPYTTLFRSPPARSWRFPSGRSAGRAASWAKDRGWLDDGVDALIDDQCGLVEQDAEIAGDRRKIGRSEEHTSELQSLMRISYAVFCLTQKTKQDNIKDHIQ